MNLQDIKKKAQYLDERGGQTYLANPKEILWLVGEIERRCPPDCLSHPSGWYETKINELKETIEEMGANYNKLAVVNAGLQGQVQRLQAVLKELGEAGDALLFSGYILTEGSEDLRSGLRNATMRGWKELGEEPSDGR